MFKRIIWATDGSEPAEKAMPYAKELAQAEGASLVVVHAVERFATHFSAGLPVYADEDETKRAVERQVEELRSAGIDVDLRMADARGVRPAYIVADLAKQLDADLIVVGTRGHTAMAGLLLGSVAHRLLHIAPCPVLSVPAAAHETETELRMEAAETTGQTG